MSSEMLNRTVFCQDPTLISSPGIWGVHRDPLNYAVPLLLTQLALISIVSKAVDLCLRPLGQSNIVSQILGGIVLGPSFLGQIPKLAEKLFPTRGTIIMETIAVFGVILFFFSIAVKMDARSMLRPKRPALSIAISLYIVTMLLPIGIVMFLQSQGYVGPAFQKSLFHIVGSQALMAFPAIACLLDELKIVNTEVGRLAVATSMFYNLLAMCTTAVIIAFLGAHQSSVATSLSSLGSTLGLGLAIVFGIRPLMLKFILTRDPNSGSRSGTRVNELQLACLFVLVFICTLGGEVIGQHYFLGPTILGLGVPDSSPIGSDVVNKLDTFVSGILYPTFLTISGLKTDFFTIQMQESGVISAIVVIGVFLKFGAIMIPASYENIPYLDAFVLGLVLNARGINELLLYNLVLESQQISEQEFALLVTSILLITAIITPLIRFLYDPSRQFIPMKRMTIQHARRDAEIKIAVCVHNHDNVPTLINLLEASCATEDSPISVVAIVLVEIVGQSAPMLVAYKPHKSLESSNSGSNQIANAFLQYEAHNEGCASVEVLTNMSRADAMHNDVCRVAVSKKSNMVIVPFHKQWAIDGTIGTVNRSIQGMNRKIIDWAPCSLGILIDRGPINGCMSILNSRVGFSVAVLFIGGSDDVESLAYGARMAMHGRVTVTIIRYLLLGHENTRERKHDTAIIDEYRSINAGNENFVYQEVLVKDGDEMAGSLTSMENKYDLMIVGRDHQNTPLLYGLQEWSECPELGVVGDLLACPDSGITASVLVVQQQKLVGKVNTSACLLQKDRARFSVDETSNGRVRSGRQSVSISIG